MSGDNGDIDRRIDFHNRTRAMNEGAKTFMDRAKAARDQTNDAFAKLSEGLKTTENTLSAIQGPVGKFLSEHCGFKDGDAFPMWDDLYEALCRSLPSGDSPDA